MNTTPDTEGNLIEHNGNYYVRCEAHEETIRRLQEKHEEAISSRDTYWKEQLQKAREEELEVLAVHLDRQLSGYTSVNLDSIYRYIEERKKALHSELDQDNK